MTLNAGTTAAMHSLDLLCLQLGEHLGWFGTDRCFVSFAGGGLSYSFGDCVALRLVAASRVDAEQSLDSCFHVSGTE
jgi:hypothetical protein